MVGRDMVSWMLADPEAASLVLRVSLLSLGTASGSAECYEHVGEGPSTRRSAQGDSGGLLTRAIAVRVGQDALHAGLLEHVLDEHAFEDKVLFYVPLLK